jgi:hypothetical protein
MAILLLRFVPVTDSGSLIALSSRFFYCLAASVRLCYGDDEYVDRVLKVFVWCMQKYARNLWVVEENVSYLKNFRKVG